MPVELIDHQPPEHKDSVREELARGGLKTAFYLETLSGWKAIDSPYEPRGEAERALGRVSEGAHVLVLGCGSGFFAEELEARGVASALLVSPVRALVERTAKRLSKLDSIRTAFQLVASQDATRCFSEQIEPYLKEHPDVIVLHHPRETRAVPGFFTQLDVLLHGRTHPPRFRSNWPPTKVLLPGRDGLLERELIHAAQNAGMELRTCEPFAGTRVTVEQAFDILEREAPDLVLSTNNQGSDADGVLPEVCKHLGVRWATWLLDDPTFLVGVEEQQGAGRDRVGFAWDGNGIDAWRNLGFQNVHPLPLATDANLFTPGEGDPDLNGRVVFVGSPRFASAPGFFHLLDQHPGSSAVVSLLMPEVRRTRRTPSVRQVQEAIHSLGLEGSFDPEALRRLPAYAVQQANRDYRIEMIAALAPLNPVVYGAGWEGLLPGSVELLGPVDYYNDLPTIYRSDAVHISLTNLQMRAWPNQRVFDVAAAGQVVVMDELEGLHDLFGDAVEGLTFSSVESMCDLVDRLLRSAELRQQHAQALRQVVLDQHTIAHRLATMIDQL
ncbi:glycosyltransferase [bacterium]|nr:glycosyltransferase [bacterium]